MNAKPPGHRATPHTADIRIEAWAPTRERCVAEAVLGAVEAFLDVSSALASGRHRRRITVESDADLLAAVLDEVVYLLDTSGEVPIDVELAPADGDLEVQFATVDAETLPQIGAVPKAVSLHELSLESGPDGWSCSLTLDV